MIYRNTTQSVNLTKVRAVIRDLVAVGCPSICRTAAELDVSSRSLQRLLSHYGTSYSDLLGDVLHEAACDLLRDPSLTIVMISRRLGYQDPSSFSRAFVRWTGCPPSRFRASLRHQGK